MQDVIAKINELPDLITVEEAAAFLRVSKMTIYRAVNDGTMNSFRVGRSFRIPQAALIEYLKMGYRSGV